MPYDHIMELLNFPEFQVVDAQIEDRSTHRVVVVPSRGAKDSNDAACVEKRAFMDMTAMTRRSGI